MIVPIFRFQTGHAQSNLRFEWACNMIKRLKSNILVVMFLQTSVVGMGLAPAGACIYRSGRRFDGNWCNFCTSRRIFLSTVGFIWYPVQRLLRKRKVGEIKKEVDAVEYKNRAIKS